MGDGDGTDSSCPKFLDASVCGFPENPENGDADVVSAPPKSGNQRVFLGRAALRLIWLPASIEGGSLRF
jgi:hypothetical protein